MFVFLYLAFTGLCLFASAVHFLDHQRHHVPGLLFVSMAILLEGLEYFWIALHLETDDVYFKNIITGFRILMVIGFWLGVRYGRRPLRDVKRPDHALGLAAEGYLGFLSNILRHPWRLFRAGYQRVRSWHTEKRD